MESPICMPPTGIWHRCINRNSMPSLCNRLPRKDRRLYPGSGETSMTSFVSTTIGRCLLIIASASRVKHCKSLQTSTGAIMSRSKSASIGTRTDRWRPFTALESWPVMTLRENRNQALRGRQRRSAARLLLREEQLRASPSTFLPSTVQSGQFMCYKTGQFYLLTTEKSYKKIFFVQENLLDTG